MSAPKREDVTAGRRKLHVEELHNLYYSRNIIRVIKSRRMRRVVYLPYMDEIRNAYTILVGKPERKRPIGNLVINRWLILKLMLNKQYFRGRTGFNWLRIGARYGLL
jgi:hypothetical protein